MSRLARLPRIMLAPNGARRGKADHPALPVTIAETVAAARAGFAAGAQALHAHVRDAAGQHTLDAGLYRELIAAMAEAVPAMPVQITTEAVGRHAPDEQRAVVRAVMPEGVSVALREMWPQPGPDRAAAAFYAWAAEAGIAVQHILYGPDDVARLAALAGDGALPQPLQLLFVLGSYASQRPARPGELDAMLAAAGSLAEAGAWAVCAFGRHEQACLLAAAARGGCMRIGFENNIARPDGTPARDNAGQVAALVRALAAQDA
ncbi:3-keto-5-aminohexanoate cleavage protein [Aquibium sp. A9E412]|uniref:3-keto-5-aminohexanoate cleavage protein n=1 Tax=Aquibium sp. A9E412 TaxID=2976767 RepID=UPI0025AEF873|nr:3-keto-5-aminohexanoate cleavage protein [Aquibium sp. A9E412]MDN2567769.1 3-keto-5-aminohexanoate cleavage protein [Aquibium sp. A9E412]